MRGTFVFSVIGATLPCLLIGCGTPCEGLLTDSEVDVLLAAVEGYKNSGIPKDAAILEVAAGCGGDFECRQCGEWIVNLVWNSGLSAEKPRWEVFEAQNVASVCGVVNVASLEFAVRSCDGALVLVTGPDEGYSNTFVTLEGDVLIDGQLSGFIDYEQDADGFFTLWWFSEDGFLIDFDDLASEPFESDALPSDFSNVACAASDLWAGDADCGAEFGNEIMRPVFIGGDR